MTWSPRLGVLWEARDRGYARVWAPRARHVDLRLLTPRERCVPLTRTPDGYHEARLEGVRPGVQYQLVLEGRVARPDPATRFQPDGVHGPSQIVDRRFAWHDTAWHGLPLESYVLYELHVGTFTEAGTFDAIIPHLTALRALGVTALELMPVAAFPGRRNWGYDGVHLFAVHAAYGGPEGLKRLVDACHQRGLAVVLDVVYNHLGPEGNGLRDFGPYFTDRYRTPWGDAVNFDGEGREGVREFFIENALMWILDYHVDALRLDALHAVFDASPDPFLRQLAAAVHTHAQAAGRPALLIGESDLNDTTLIRSPQDGGYGLDAQWNDDFHHALHALLTGERAGYYQDFGSLDDLAKAMREGYVFSGQRSAFRRRPHGMSSQQIPARRFVIFSQNHDQVGNRMRGERLSGLVEFERLKLAACAVLLAPGVPLLFMGEEYGEPAPFQYFVSHSDPALVEAVRQGRREAFRAFGWPDAAPDPQAEDTFAACRLHHALRHLGQHRKLAALYQELLRLRTSLPALRRISKAELEVTAQHASRLLTVHRWHEQSDTLLVLHFGDTPAPVSLAWPAGTWRNVLDTAARDWGGPGGLRPSRAAGPEGTTARPEASGSVTLPAWSGSLWVREEA